MRHISFKTINHTFVDLSILLGIFVAWLVKDQFSLIIFGKVFLNRSIFIQLSILLFLIVLMTFLSFILVSYLASRKMVVIPARFQSVLTLFNQKALPFLTIGTALLATYIAIRYANQPLLEMHSFRQTHTALTSYWMMREGWRLAYQTPVVGYPWSIPIEFPIYQSLVAFIAMLGHFKLDQVGRLISFGFLIGCAWPAFKITHRLNLPANVAWVFCALLWSSPIYLFWGRTFMIETAAVFFSFAAVPYAPELFKPRPQWRCVLLFTFWSILGMLQKASTTGPMLLVLAIVTLIIHLKSSGFKMPPMRKIACVLVAFVLPTIIGLIWTSYADFIKEQNPMGIYNTSTELINWNFGSLRQRFNLNILQTIFWDRVLFENTAGYFGVILIFFSMITNDRRIKYIMLTSIVLFIAPVLIFINVHLIHNYYQVSCTLFIIYTLAIAVVFLTPRLMGNNLIVFAITLILITSNLFYFNTGYANSMRSSINTSNNTTLAIGDVIKRYTPQDSAIVVFGSTWTSQYAYYSERKAFTVPDWFNEYDKIWDDPVSFLGGKQLGAIVFCGPKLNDIVKQPNVARQPTLFNVGCYIWIPNVKSIQLPGIDYQMHSILEDN